MQMAFPAALWKRSLGQSSQVPLFSKRPASHFTQKLCLPSGCTEPAGHGVHLLWSLAAEKVCGAQSRHVRSDVLVTSVSTASPGRQLCASANRALRELMQKCFGGQGSHDPLVTLPNVPEAHATSHDVEFAALNALQSQRAHGAPSEEALNVPAGQTSHVPLPAGAALPAGQPRLAPTMLHSAVLPALAIKSGLRLMQSPGCSGQFEAPASEKRPFSQIVHVPSAFPASFWDLPATQLEQILAAGGVAVPDGQVLHSPSSAVAANLPAGQGEEEVEPEAA